jgi:hypothetical protein
MAVAAAADVLSPELVLVSSPDEAARARELLPDFVLPVRRIALPSRTAAAIFDAVCATGTLGPLLLALLTR